MWFAGSRCSYKFFEKVLVHKMTYSVKEKIMRKNQWNFRLSLILIMLILGLGLIKTHPVSAASSIPVDLETGYIYTYYDVTGDGRKDNFTVKAVSLDTYYTGDGYYNAVYLCVNGRGQYIKLKNMQMPFYSLKARLYIFDNARPLLYLSAKSDNDHKFINGILRYENGRWKYLLDMTKVFGDYKQYARGEVIDNSGNNLKVRYEVMCWTIGFCRLDYTYIYKNGVLKPASSYGKIIDYRTRYNGDRTIIANKSIRAYKKCGGGGTSFVLRKGNKAVVQKWRYTGGRLYIRLKYGSKTGWINGQKQKNFVSSEQQWFSNLPYV